MRYYIYLDKNFIKNIYSAIDNVDFSIDVLEFSEENSFKTSNHIGVDPEVEDCCETECEDKDDNKKIRPKRSRSLLKKRTNISYAYSESRDNRKSRRYINIQDVTDIKCFGFYHNLLCRLIDLSREDKMVTVEAGIIEQMYLPSSESLGENSNKLKMFKINDCYVFANKDEMDIDIELLCYSKCKINVAGYILNDNFQNGCALVKALAIYKE